MEPLIDLHPSRLRVGGRSWAAGESRIWIRFMRILAAALMSCPRGAFSKSAIVTMQSRPPAATDIPQGITLLPSDAAML